MERNTNRAKGWALALGFSLATYAVISGGAYLIAYLVGVFL